MLRNAQEVLRSCLEAKEKLIVGLSGGADSVALAHLLYSEGYEIICIHINFHLRGDESNRDQKFVEELVEKHFPLSTLIVKHYDTEYFAQERGISIEMAARELRYQYYREIAQEHNCRWIAVGHHADDQVETGLLNLVRGSGGAGLAGMSKASNGILRPLLNTWRSEIESYLSYVGLQYVTDSTNREIEYKRNYIRHKMIPMFERLNPSFRQVMLRNMEHFMEEQSVLDTETQRFEDKYFDHKTQSLTLPPHTDQDYYFKRLMLRYGFNYSQAEDMLRDWMSDKTSTFHSHTQMAQIYRERLFVMPHDPTTPPNPQTLLNTVDYGKIGKVSIGGKSGQLAIHARFSERNDIILRAGRDDDTFRPFGMNRGRKKLFRYLGEKGIPEAYRPLCPVLECEEQIIAVIPLEISDMARYDQKPLFLSFKPTEHPLAQLLTSL